MQSAKNYQAENVGLHSNVKYRSPDIKCKIIIAVHSVSVKYFKKIFLIKTVQVNQFK